MIHKLNEVLEDKEFAEAYDKIDNVDDAIAALHDKGVEVTKEEFQQLIDITRIVNAGNEELSDELLERVSGGITINKDSVCRVPGKNERDKAPKPIWNF